MNENTEITEHLYILVSYPTKHSDGDNINVDVQQFKLLMAQIANQALKTWSIYLSPNS